MFLRSELEYEYPYNAKSLWAHQRTGCNWVRYLFRHLIGLNRRSDIDNSRYEIIDDRIWPFSSRRDYNEALKHPVYLAGTA